MSDNRHGGRQAAEHLLVLGHMRLGVVTVSGDDPAAVERLVGARDAALRCGGQRTAATLDIERCESNVASGAAAATRLLERHPERDRDPVLQRRGGLRRDAGHPGERPLRARGHQRRWASTTSTWPDLPSRP